MPNPRVLNRRLHRWGAIVAALPFGVVIVTGILLQLKKQLPWVQPPERRGSGAVPAVAWSAMLDSARTRPALGVASWNDVDRIDVRPGKGIAKLTTSDGMELQLDLGTGAVLQVARRRSDLIEALHDGSWFHDAAKLWVFLPSALLVAMLWGTGLYLFVLPIRARARRR
jgi:uncharacterized iron-regulated membrane protein